jgi:hypothetical protein
LAGGSYHFTGGLGANNGNKSGDNPVGCVIAIPLNCPGNGRPPPGGIIIPIGGGIPGIPIGGPPPGGIIIPIGGGIPCIPIGGPPPGGAPATC